MEKLTLTSEIRTGKGKNASRKIRAAGRIPATLYGHKEEPVSLAVDEASLRAILHTRSESAVVDLSIKGKTAEALNVIVRDVQRHPASGKLLHVDFQRISLDEKIRVEVKVTLSGDPKGVKEQGGILEHLARSLNIMCLPTSIPDSLDVDVSDLGIGDSRRLKHLVGAYPEVEFLDDLDTALATVIPPSVEEVKVAAVVGEEAEEAAEPEVIKKKADAEKEEAGGED